MVGVVGSAALVEDSDSIVCEYENGHEKEHEKGYEKRYERSKGRDRVEKDKDRVEKAAEPGRGPSGRVGEAVLWPHEVAGTEGPVGCPRASRNVEGVGLSPASGKGGIGTGGNSRAFQGLVEEDGVARVHARQVLCARAWVREREALCAEVQVRERQRLGQGGTGHGDVLVGPEDGPAQQEEAVCRERVRSSGVDVGRVGAPEHRALEQAF